MTGSKYEVENYTTEYLKLLSSALTRSALIGFGDNPRISTSKSVSQEQLSELQSFAYNELYPELKNILPIYWGNSCQLLSAHACAVLNSKGYNAELIIGEVEINGTLEFDTNIDTLRRELDSQEDRCDDQELHVWVSLGSDIIVDCGLPDRMIKNYKVQEKYMPPIMIDTASNLSRQFRARHQPMLLGAEFLAKTNSLNMGELINHYKKHPPIRY